MGAHHSKKHARTRTPITKTIRDIVWIKYHGEREKGMCYCCGNEIIRYQTWHCSHVRAHNKGGDLSIENLRVCCRHCNLSMGDQNMYVYIRDKNLTGPGVKNLNKYFNKHPSQLGDKRTNNWQGKR